MSDARPMELHVLSDAKMITILAAKVANLQDKIDGLEADLESAIEVAWNHGATDWVRMNYPSHKSNGQFIAKQEEE